MTTTQTKYRILTERLRDGIKQSHDVTVSTRKNHSTNRITKSVDTAELGCSRDYQTFLDTVAVQNLLTEHGLRMTKMEKIG